MPSTNPDDYRSWESDVEIISEINDGSFGSAIAVIAVLVGVGIMIGTWIANWLG